MKRKKIGYTLTELLVVVMIVAVLSAVVLPKFNKVLETRKTSEAEDLMTAVRQEQEYRCASDRPYTVNADSLQSLASAKTKNYTLSLKEAGIEAARGEKNYTLKIPSYADGRICCDGAYCAELNKDYPSCNEMSVKASPSSCVVAGLQGNTGTMGSECTDGEKQYDPCGPTCDRGNKLVRECVDGAWQARNGQCLNASGGEITNHECSCEYYSGAKPPDTTQSCNVCGHQDVTYSCDENTWHWVPNTGACDVEAGNCPCNGTQPEETQECSSCGGEQTRTVTCNGTTGEYETGEWGDCSIPESECDKTCEPSPIYATYTISGYSGGTGWSGGSESFYMKPSEDITFVGGYECLDENGEECSGCSLPSCNDMNFFLEHKDICCRTEMGEIHPAVYSVRRKW